MAPIYYRNSDGAIIVYDVTIPETLEKVEYKIKFNCLKI
jgi:GTPase SAR1 family protein